MYIYIYTYIHIYVYTSLSCSPKAVNNSAIVSSIEKLECMEISFTEFSGVTGLVVMDGTGEDLMMMIMFS
jgi:L-rhamnose isomerase